MMQVIVTGKWTQGIEEILKELDDKILMLGCFESELAKV